MCYLNLCFCYWYSLRRAYDVSSEICSTFLIFSFTGTGICRKYFFSQDRNVGCIVVLNMGLLLYFFSFSLLSLFSETETTTTTHQIGTQHKCLVKSCGHAEGRPTKIVVVTENINITFPKVCCVYNRLDLVYKRTSISSAAVKGF